MDLALWRWSTAAQISSAIMIAVFFAALVRSYPRVEVRWWFRAWLMNIVALSATAFYWYFHPSDAVQPIVRGVFLAGRTTFVLMLLQGASALMRPGSALLSGRRLATATLVALVVGVFVLTNMNLIGVGQALLMSVLLTAGVVFLSREGDRGVIGLAAGMGIAALLSAIEAAAYASQVAPLLPDELTALAQAFLSGNSLLYTGSEWLIALGCVLAAADRGQRDLRLANDRLLTAQFELRRLIDRDPLTGLDNRRALPEVFRSVQPHGATLLFFDLDGFKAVNDLHGHHVGDECLKQFSTALKDCFRPSDAVVRIGGDEFLVVVSHIDRGNVDDRLARVRWRLRKAAVHAPAIVFSVGVAELLAGGSPDAALQEADEAMYRAKDASARDSATA